MSSFLTPAFVSLRSALAASAALAASSVFAQTSINLTQDATVRQAGTYTYYARGNAAGETITPFTTMFYPGGELHTYAGATTLGLDGTLVDNGSNGAPISFGVGELTDNSNASEVRGWINVEQVSAGTHSASPHGGQFDIVFDLGANYVITSVVVTYTDAAGWRFRKTVANTQQVFTSTGNPSLVGDAGLTLFDTATAVGGATLGQLTFSGTSVGAQYVIFRPEMDLATNIGGNSYGGYIYEVAINGYAIPEPSSAAALAGVVALGGVVLRRQRRSGSVR